MKVGFIGLGIMGKPMSKNLVKAGHELVVFDFKQESVDELVALGAKGAKSGAEVAAECDTIITMVPNSPHVRAACLGENGISDTAKPGTVVIDMSSIDPVESKKIGAELAEKGMAIILISSELPEIMNMCDNVCIVRSGNIVGRLAKNELNQEAIMHYATGGNKNE